MRKPVLDFRMNQDTCKPPECLVELRGVPKPGAGQCKMPRKDKKIGCSGMMGMLQTVIPYPCQIEGEFVDGPTVMMSADTFDERSLRLHTPLVTSDVGECATCSSFPTVPPLDGGFCLGRATLFDFLGNEEDFRRFLSSNSTLASSILTIPEPPREATWSRSRAISLSFSLSASACKIGCLSDSAKSYSHSEAT